MINQGPDIHPQQSLELLKALHILTIDGKMNLDSRRKLKQVYHLYQFIAPLLEVSLKSAVDFSVVDMGAGKSYLGFIIYDLFFKKLHKGQLFAIESRLELIDQSIALAQKLAFNRMHFINCQIHQSLAEKSIPAKISILTALHACDTATDDAIHFGLKKQADFMVLVPCCQAEVAQILKQKKSNNKKNYLMELWRRPLHTREFGSHVTNVLRCLYLESKGYQVSVTELTGWEHSMKNELIIAKMIDQPNQQSCEKLQQILTELQLDELKEKFS